MPRINPPNSNSVSRLTTYYLEDADAINIPGNQLDQKSIKIRTAQNLTGSYKVGTSKLISEINDGSYKKDYLSFWERFCAFFAGLVDRNAGIKYLVSHIVGDDNKADFAEALIKQLLGNPSDSTKKEILSKVLLETINTLNTDNVNETNKTTLATGIFDKLCQMEDDSLPKETSGTIFKIILEHLDIVKNYNVIASLVKRVVNMQNRQAQENLIQILSFAMGNIWDTVESFNMLRDIRPSVSEENFDFLEKIAISTLNYKESILDEGYETLRKEGVPNSEYIDLFRAVDHNFYFKFDGIEQSEIQNKMRESRCLMYDCLMFEERTTENKDKMDEYSDCIANGGMINKVSIPKESYEKIEKIFNEFIENTIQKLLSSDNIPIEIKNEYESNKKSIATRVKILSIQGSKNEKILNKFLSKISESFPSIMLKEVSEKLSALDIQMIFSRMCAQHRYLPQGGEDMGNLCQAVVAFYEKNLNYNSQEM